MSERSLAKSLSWKDQQLARGQAKLLLHPSGSREPKQMLGGGFEDEEWLGAWKSEIHPHR
jgi:hypothetical protein